MRSYFYQLAEFAFKQLHSHEVLLCYFEGEDSDFIRFNHAKIRQAGTVTQRYITLELITGQKHATQQLTLSGEIEIDQQRLTENVTLLRTQLAVVPNDPYLLYATEAQSTELQHANQLPATADVLNSILQAVQGLDFVGFYASGGMFKGFANNLGLRHWYESYSFNLDWSVYHSADKAVKSSYAGFIWDNATFQAKIDHCRQQLALLQRPAITLSPQPYRVFLAPAAVSEVIQMLNWDGFSLKAQRSKQTPLLKMLDGEARLHPSVTLQENLREGLAAPFQQQGFVKAECVTLINAGQLDTPLISPRSAKEYGLIPNGEEGADSFDLAAGQLAQTDVLKSLDTGIYINNLWYLNYSDFSGARITGMTRFASFWVEKGEIVAPINVMRFDETIYRLLGDNLLALTVERDFIAESQTYDHRSCESMRLPGALIQDFTFTL